MKIEKLELIQYIEIKFCGPTECYSLEFEFNSFILLIEG